MTTRLSDATRRGVRHRQYRIALIALACVIVTATGCAQLQARPDPATSPTPKPARRSVVFIGDSLTVGLYASTIDSTFASRLAVLWRAELLDRVGIAGVHATGLFSSVDTMQTGATDVVLEVGTNDFLNTTPAEFDPSYRALIASLRRHEPHARIICLGLWRSAQERSASGQGPDAYDEVIQADCPGPFVSLQALFMDPSNRGPANSPTFQGRSDTFHPNDHGHTAIATTIAAQVTP